MTFALTYLSRTFTTLLALEIVNFHFKALVTSLGPSLVLLQTTESVFLRLGEYSIAGNLTEIGAEFFVRFQARSLIVGLESCQCVTFVDIFGLASEHGPQIYARLIQCKRFVKKTSPLLNSE